jgi:probable F420-dependent oxidoreductase
VLADCTKVSRSGALTPQVKQKQRPQTRYAFRISRNWLPAGSIIVVTVISGRRREMRSISHVDASVASAFVGQRATTSRPPFRCKRSTVAMIGAASNTNNDDGHGTTAAFAPFFVLQPRWARRSCSTPVDFVFAFVMHASTLGPRSSFVDIFGSTGSSHNQHRQPSRSPTSSVLVMPCTLQSATTVTMMPRPTKVRIGFAVGGQAMLVIDQFGAVLDDLERLGFDSVWLPETFLGGTYDPIVGLSYAAGRVKKLKLGTHLAAPGRNPVLLAKTLANLDQLSNGRLLLVFVPGLPSAEERAVQGMPTGDRNVWFDTHLPTLRALWRGESVDGVRLDPIPHQQPLEVWFGGKATAALERAGRLSDGWLGGAVTLDEAVEARITMQRAAAEVGREISPEHFGVNLTYTRDASASPADVPTRNGGDIRDVVAFGLPALRELAERWIDAGFTKIVVRPAIPPTDWPTELAALAAAVVDLQT